MRRHLLPAFVLLLGAGLLRGGEAARVRLEWSEFGSRLAGNQVVLVLPGGTHVEGKVRGVRDDGLHLRVTKTSDRAVLRKGEQRIPRKSISVLRVTEYRKLGRLLTVAGTLGAASGVLAAKRPEIYGGPLVIVVPAVSVGGMAGLAVGSYYAGKRLDRRVTEIAVAPER